MRILHVTTYLQGGAGRVIADLAIEQRRAGHDVIVVSDSEPHAGYASYQEYLEALGRADVERHTVRSTFRRDVPLNVDAAGELSRLIGHRQVDVIHAHAAIPAMVARLAFGSRATPLIVTVHGWGLVKTADQARTDLTLLRLVDAVVTPSAALRDRLQGLGVPPDIVRVLPYGIGPASSQAIERSDKELFASIRLRDGRIVVCVGSVGERKNQRLLVRAIAESGFENVHAIFIGEGETAPLEAEAEESGVARRVHVLGYRTDASRYLPHADALVLPSLDEGLPLVVLEALRGGVPVVASDIPEIREALGDDRRGCFLCGSNASLADALGRTLSLGQAERAHLAAAQRKRWEQRYRLDQMVAGYEAFYMARVVGSAPHAHRAIAEQLTQTDLIPERNFICHDA